jgi:hypothetical protein
MVRYGSSVLVRPKGGATARVDDSDIRHRYAQIDDR